jgi:hypothetical protein
MKISHHHVPRQRELHNIRRGLGIVDERAESVRPVTETWTLDLHYEI